MITVVIILTMIGPEERKVDHIKEHAEMGEENGSDFTEGKADSHGHAEGRTHSKYALENEAIEKMNYPERTIE